MKKSVEKIENTVLTNVDEIFERNCFSGFVTCSQLERLNSFLSLCPKICFLAGDLGSGKTSLALNLAFARNNGFSKVFYTRFDKEEYLFYGKRDTLDDESILKRCLYNLFERVEEIPDKNSLLIVDNFEISDGKSLESSLGILNKLECKILIVADRKNVVHSLEYPVFTVDALDKDSTVTELLNQNFNEQEATLLYENFGFNVLCMNIAKSICKARNMQVEEFVLRFKTEAEIRNLSVNKDWLLLFYYIAEFSYGERELLRTLCPLVAYCKTYPDEDGKMQIMNREAVSRVLPKLGKKLDKLIDCGFVSQTNTGRIVVDRAVIKLVLEFLKPNSSNCQSYMNYIHKTSNYEVDQTEKDFYGRLVLNNISGINSLLSPSQYACFAKMDKEALKILYNILCISCFEDSYKNSLSRKNYVFCVLLFVKLAKQDKGVTLYNKQLQISGCDTGVFTATVRLNCDIIRFSLNALKHKGFYTAEECNMLLRTVNEAVESILSEAAQVNTAESNKMILLDEVISLFENTLENSYLFEALKELDYERILYGKRNENHKLLDMQEGTAFGNNRFSTRMYINLYRLLEMYVAAWKKSDLHFDNKEDRIDFFEKLEDRQQVKNSIIMVFTSLQKGIENFYDFYDEKLYVKNTESIAFNRDFESRLSKNKYLFNTSFDGGKKNSAEKYALQIMTSVKNSENPLKLVCFVLGQNTVLSDKVLDSLLKFDFVKICCTHKSMPFKEKQLLLEYLIDVYNEFSTHSNINETRLKLLSKLRENMILSLYGKLNTEVKNICREAASLMLLENISYIAAEYINEKNDVIVKQAIREKLDSGNFGFWRIYNTVFVDSMCEASYEETFAKSLLCSIYEKECTWVKKKELQTAVKLVILEYMTDDSDFDAEGFKVLLKLLPH